MYLIEESAFVEDYTSLEDYASKVGPNRGNRVAPISLRVLVSLLLKE